jgi:hypothetical protein
MGQEQSFLTSQQKPDSPTKKWAPPLLFLSNHIYNNFCADLLSLDMLRAMCQTITSLQAPTRVQMRTKNEDQMTLSHKGGGASLQGPHC